MGCSLEFESKPDSLAADGNTEQPLTSRKKNKRKTLGPSFFTLSGGILKRDPRTSNRIDSLLSRMMEEEPAKAYSPHVERNLEYLYTSLQLDMISIAAELYKPEEAEEEEDEEPL
jgi:hypothetical protein